MGFLGILNLAQPKRIKIKNEVVQNVPKRGILYNVQHKKEKLEVKAYYTLC